MKIKHKILLFFLIPSLSYSQVMKFKAKRFAIMSESGKKIKPPIWTKTNILVVVNMTDDKIHIYSKEDQPFDIIKYSPLTENENGTAYTFTCVDKKGYECLIYLLIWKDKRREFTVSMVINSKGVKYGYNLEPESVN